MEGLVDFITLDDLCDDVAGCFHDNPVGPAQCRSLMKTVVTILELCGFRRSLQAQGKRRLTRCLSFDPVPDSLRRLDTGREVIAGELVRATQTQNSMRDNSSERGCPAPAVCSETPPDCHKKQNRGSDPSPTQDKTDDKQPLALAETHCNMRSGESASSGNIFGQGDRFAKDPEQPRTSATEKTETQTSTSGLDAVHAPRPIDSVAPTDAPSIETTFHLKARLRPDADAAVEMLLDDLLDDVVDEMNRLHQARGVNATHESVESSSPAADASRKSQRSIPVDVSPILQRLAALVQAEDQLVAKYEARRQERLPPMSAALESSAAPQDGVRANAVSTDKATAAAFVDARLALAAGHRDRQLMIGAFHSLKIEAAEAPRLAAITFSLVKLKAKMMLPLWRRLAWTRASARSFLHHHRGRRFFALLCQSTTECRNERVARSHRADVQLCQALMLWHAHVQDQQLCDRDLCANLADRIRINLIHKGWSKWRAAENGLLAIVHRRRSLVLSSLHRWRVAVDALRLWHQRWNNIVRRIAFTSWRRCASETSLISAKFQAAVSNRQQHVIRLHVLSWGVAATEKRRLRVARDAVEKVAKRANLSFGIAALRCATLLNRHCSVVARRRRLLVWRAWLNEHKLVVHGKSRAFEAWKVFVGLARLETWLAHVRYTIHGRWVVVDCFYEWKRRTMIWVQGRNLSKTVEQAAKSRYMQRWIDAFAKRSGDSATVAGSNAGQSLSSVSDISHVSDIDEDPPGAQNSSDALSSGRQAVGVDDLIEHRFAEVKAELANQCEAFQNALASQQQGLLSEIRTDVGDLNQRLAAFGVLSPAIIDLLQSAMPRVQREPPVPVAGAGAMAASTEQTGGEAGVAAAEEASAWQIQREPDVAMGQPDTVAVREAELALLAKLEVAETARKEAEEQAAAAMASEDKAAREFDAKVAQAEAARIAAEEQRAAAVQARDEEARRATVAATSSAAKIEAAEAGRLVAEELQAVARREREEEVAAVQKKASLEAAIAEQAALVASEAYEAALKAETDKIRKDADARIAQATRKAEMSIAPDVAEMRTEEGDGLAMRAFAPSESHSHQSSEQAAQEAAAPELDPLYEDPNLRPDTSTVDASTVDTSTRIAPPVESQVRRVVVQTSATVKPLGDDISALQLRKEQLRKEQLAQQARAGSRNNRSAQSQFARQSAGSEHDDWSAATSASSRRLARRPDPEPLFPVVENSSKNENADEHAQPTERLSYVAPAVSSPSVPTALRAEDTAVLDFSDEVSFNAPADTQSLSLEASTEEGHAAPVLAGGSDHQLSDHSGSKVRSAHLDSAPEVIATSSSDVASGPAAAIDEPSNTPPGSDPADTVDADVEPNRIEKIAIAETVRLEPAADIGVASNRTNENRTDEHDSSSNDADAGEPPANAGPPEDESPEDREMRQKFEELDTDNSGALDANELAQLIKELLDTDGDDTSKKKGGAKQVCRP